MEAGVAPLDDASDDPSVGAASDVDVPSFDATTVGVAVADAVGVASSVEGVPVAVCVTDGVGVKVGVPLSGDGVAVEVAITGVWVSGRRIRWG